MESESLDPSNPNTPNLKAVVVVTWVPKHVSGSELTVIAMESVSVLHFEPISLYDNPLSHLGQDQGSDLNAMIILQSMHWTRIHQTRNGKVGVVPSNILCFEGNPIRQCWIKVRVQHSYLAKSKEQLTVETNERIQIYGEVDSLGMILAKRKTGQQGRIPYAFIEIPAAVPSHSRVHTFPMIQMYQIPPTGSYPHGPSSLSALSDSEEYANQWDASNTQNDPPHSRHSSLDHGRSHPSSGKQLKFVIDGQGVMGPEGSVSPAQWTK